MSTVTVQIVTFNSADDIINCLKAISYQSFRVTEIIIVDNNSSDQTIEKIEDWRKNNTIAIKIVRNSENVGFAGGHNLAINLTHSDYVLVLNPDVVLDKDYISQLVDVLEKNPNTGSVSGKLYRNRNQKILDSTGLTIKKNRRVFDRGSNEVDTGQWDVECNVFGVSGAAAIYRRTMIKNISFEKRFFDERFFAYKEDVDVAWRAQIFGWSSMYVPIAKANHSRGWKEHKKREEIPLFVRKHSYINRYYCILKNDSLLYLLLHFPYILSYEVLAISYALIKERDIIAAWKQLFNNFSFMYNQRKYIQKNRKGKISEVYRFFL